MPPKIIKPESLFEQLLGGTKRVLVALAACVTALTVIGGVLVGFWGWTPASSEDVEKLEGQQLDTAQEVYQQKYDDLTVLNSKLRSLPNTSDQEQAIVGRQLNETTRKLEFIQQRKIEMSR